MSILLDRYRMGITRLQNRLRSTALHLLLQSMDTPNRLLKLGIVSESSNVLEHGQPGKFTRLDLGVIELRLS